MTWPRRSFIAWPRWKSSIFPGNDLVWLKDPHNRGRHSDTALLRRVLTARERLLVQVSDDGDRMLWSLWAAKEAAFKALVREIPTTIFSPQAIEVESARDRAPTVTWGARSWTITWEQGPDWVHAWVGDGWLPAVEAFEGDESAAVRLLAERTAEAAGWGRGLVEGRPPSLKVGNRDWPVSLSHDGPWAAVVVPRPNR